MYVDNLSISITILSGDLLGALKTNYKLNFKNISATRPILDVLRYRWIGLAKF